MPQKSRWHSLFFFSSRRRHTRLVSDWSSDVCSSDLVLAPALIEHFHRALGAALGGLGLLGGGHQQLERAGALGLVGLEHHVRFEEFADEIGRASCRERGWISVDGVELTRGERGVNAS